MTIEELSEQIYQKRKMLKISGDLLVKAIGFFVEKMKSYDIKECTVRGDMIRTFGVEVDGKLVMLSLEDFMRDIFGDTLRSTLPTDAQKAIQYVTDHVATELGY